MTTKTYEELMSEINLMTIEEALKNAEKCLEPFEVRDIIKQQQETINRQKAEIAKLTLDLKMIQHTATNYPHCVLRDNAAIFTKSPEDYDRWVSDITLGDTK